MSAVPAITRSAKSCGDVAPPSRLMFVPSGSIPIATTSAPSSYRVSGAVR